MNYLYQALHGHVVDAMRPVLGDDLPHFDILVAPPHQQGFDAAIDLALKAARIARCSPMTLAEELAGKLSSLAILARAEAVKPGFVNVAFSGAALAEATWAVCDNAAMASAAALNPSPRRSFDDFDEVTIIDFGGPNIKPMHVGHLRSLVLGESLRRILSEHGDVVSDIHWGDWGLPSGMILAWLDLHPEDEAKGVGFVYPAAAARAEEDEAFMSHARDCMRILQQRRPDMLARWLDIEGPAKRAILETVAVLGAHFDLLLGERDADEHMPEVIRIVREVGGAVEEDGDLLLPVEEDTDRKRMPPLMLQRADGSSLYGATDMATLLGRVNAYPVKRVVYVVDQRQSLHFEQVFRAARKWGIATPAVDLVHRGFGTVNGSDGKPLRTRSGGAMPLDELIQLVVDTARARLLEGARVPEYLVESVASCVGLSALKIADLSQPALSGYTLDIDKAVRFEGNTGPALLYAIVRLRSVMSKAIQMGMQVSDVLDPTVLDGREGTAEMREMLMCVLLHEDAVERAGAELEPCHIAIWAFKTAGAIGRFWKACPILSEGSAELSMARLCVASRVESRLAHALYLLGCDIPPAM